MFDKVLVANRGEIAIRVFRTLREMGIGSVAVYSEGDRGALHVAYADESFLLGPTPAAESYLHVERILDAAARSGAQAIHPGYGFLAENAGFAQAVEDAGLVWIGPPASAIELMGSKTAARTAMKNAGVPIIPGTTDPVGSVEELLNLGVEIGYPLLIKAAAGGGGKGMEEVHSPEQAEKAFETAQRQGQSYFANPDVYVEKLIVDPRHVEVQVLADAHGNVIHLGERDCTMQRRHQKLVEETPSPAVDAELRARIGAIGVEAARACGYRSAGTIEGLFDAGRRLLLHGDEHAHPGRAHGDRDGHGARSRARADSRRARRAAVGDAGAGRAARPRDRVPDQRRGREQGLPARAGADHGLSRAVGAGRARRLRRRGGVRGLGVVRPDDREAHRPRRRSRARPRADAARTRRVLDRGAADTDRVPPRAPVPSVLHRGDDVSRDRRVGGARRAVGRVRRRRRDRPAK